MRHEATGNRENRMILFVPLASIRALVEWAVGIPTVYRVWATCDAENLASARVLEKAGLCLEGRLRRCPIRPNISSMIPRDTFVFARIKDIV